MVITNIHFYTGLSDQYVVDRILRQQRALREAALQAERTRKEALNVPPPTQTQTPSPQTESKPLPPSQDSKPKPSSSTNDTEISSDPRDGDYSLQESTSGTSVMDSLSKWRNKITSQVSGMRPGSSDTHHPPAGPEASSSGQTRSTIARGATPLSSISTSYFPNIYPSCIEVFSASNINMAVSACRPESGNLLRNREEMTQVKETLDEGYCDVSGHVANLNNVGMSFIMTCHGADVLIACTRRHGECKGVPFARSVSVFQLCVHLFIAFVRCPWTKRLYTHQAGNPW